MNTVLVTGGAGFLGSHLCDSLLVDGYKVIALDNLSTGKITNIDHLKNNPNFQYIIDDVCDLQEFYFDKSLCQIFNLASPASPKAYQADPVKTLETNFIGTLNLLKLAKRVGAKVFQASTSEIYGDPHVHPQPETYSGNVNTVGPRSCYDEGKRVAETLMTDYSKQYGIPVKIVRIFNTYGNKLHKDDGRVVSNFITQALAGQDITIYGDGSQTRSFCYVSDLIFGFRLLMDNTPDSFIQPVNLGNPTEYTMNELANLVIRLTHSKSKIVYKDLPIDDPKQRKPDISLAKRILGWEPKIQLEEGLIKTIEYFEKYSF